MKFTGKNIHIGKNVVIGKNVRIGDNSSIYDNVIIKDNSTICNDCVIGEPLNSYYYDLEYSQPQTIIGENSLIRSHSIIYAGCELGEGLNTGHRVTIREYSIIGKNTNIGTNCDIQGYCNLGDYNRLHSNVILGQKSKTGDYVFIYPYVVLTNDPTPPSNYYIGVQIDDYSIIAASTVMLPGTIIGKHCLVGANSTVGGLVKDYSFINGAPAKFICDIRKAPFFDMENGKRHYPWPQYFYRGMPWEKIGFEEWLNSKNELL